MGVDYDGGVGPFFDAVVDEKEFSNDRENPVSMGGKGHIEVEDQSGKFVPLSNYKIGAAKKEYLYADHFQRGIKEKKSTIKNSLKERFKVSMQNRLRNVTMAEANKNAFAHFPETEMWRLLRPIDTAVVEPQNEFVGARAPTVPYYSGDFVPLSNDKIDAMKKEDFYAEHL